MGNLKKWKWLTALMLVWLLSGCNGDTNNTTIVDSDVPVSPIIEVVITGSISLKYTQTVEPEQHEIETNFNTTIVLNDGTKFPGVLVYADLENNSNLVDGEQKFILYKAEKFDNGFVRYNNDWYLKNLVKSLYVTNSSDEVIVIGIDSNPHSFATENVTVLEGEVLKKSVFIYNELTQPLIDGYEVEIRQAGDFKDFTVNLHEGFYAVVASNNDTIVGVDGNYQDNDNYGGFGEVQFFESTGLFQDITISAGLYGSRTGSLILTVYRQEDYLSLITVEEPVQDDFNLEDLLSDVSSQ